MYVVGGARAMSTSNKTTCRSGHCGDYDTKQMHNLCRGAEISLCHTWDREGSQPNSCSPSASGVHTCTYRS